MVVDNVLSSEKCNDILAVLEEKTKDFDSISNFENNRDRLDKQWDGGTVLQYMGRKLSFDYASFFSQVLKENLELIGTSPSNINIYSFNYKGSKDKYQGVIAQEVPWASMKHDNGYLLVDYSKLDVDFKKLN